MADMRISGLASGMDIDDMVSRLMSAHRIPYQKLEQKKQVMEWQRDDYRSMNAKILELRNQAFNMQLSSNYTARKAISSADSSVSATATASATEGIYTMKVTQLAKAASMTSATKLGVASDTAKLSAADTSVAPAAKFEDGDTTTLTIKGEKGSATITVKGSQTVSEFVKDFNNQSNLTGVKVSYDKALDSFFFVSAKTGESSGFSLSSEDPTLITNVLKLGTTTSGTGSQYTGSVDFAASTDVIDNTLTADQMFKIKHTPISGTAKDYEFTITKDMTVGQLMKTINSSDLGKLGVSAYIDENKKLVIKDSTGGTLAFTDETSDSKDVVAKLGLSGVTPTTYSQNKVSAGGVNAKVEFNDVEAVFETNSFQLNGINFVAKAVMTDEATITVNQDVDTVFENIKSFVTKYNEMVDLLNKELTEKRYRDFTPLTAEQREEMDEKDIERWEEKAKSGMLKGDLLIQSAVSNMRNSLMRTVQGLPSGDAKTLADIGITSGSWYENGKLYIDETKLKKAIAEKPDEVAALFTTNDGATGASDSDGLAVRFYQQADAIMDKITKKAGKESSVNSSFDIGKNLDDLEDEMENWARRLDDLQTRYYKQFTAMENALNKMNAQSTYLMQQFGGGA
ncbi:hypothetical protein FE782_19680 [Paenibacillus antri]|uniref:Flagellar hook-associated protein 2 n=1 Tax=Paenibacillus antri TaxID=2582848 RepID=A0A5R9GGP8_9BACL|nr:flagellar filament capping protein FliD [Paenibacillus antri]TLS50585.1 hypothetical protein FE782_19680 [Paenibacillus antri]